MKKILKADMDGMFARCSQAEGCAKCCPCLHREGYSVGLCIADAQGFWQCVKILADASTCQRRRFPKDDHEMFDIKYITKVRSALSSGCYLHGLKGTMEKWGVLEHCAARRAGDGGAENVRDCAGGNLLLLLPLPNCNAGTAS